MSSFYRQRERERGREKERKRAGCYTAERVDLPEFLSFFPSLSLADLFGRGGEGGFAGKVCKVRFDIRAHVRDHFLFSLFYLQGWSWCRKSCGV